ncbi:UDP-N-acetylmuramoyl-L-alanine--D-glutamate ligase [Aestuariivirga litoralis]|uniref:UDP-N-acetylmuramoylalanine--D-glutamate ligase n=1 Tax=Aestuariivirga litoralis TaxID=2650924 RepID=A0A2W2B7G7_9HYPH|nr:UDP-N-acetylmuramoyl-L-alanine--D-glutamate ligase [Aestuariivirga litoralis]PZF75998.1 UDP-N-acetylmuramoyl-L-alanine--D-glutamate ligase [Aestuariivirga litoralis]
MFPATTFKGKSVAVFGLARSGTATIEALQLGGATVHGWDDSAPAVEKARAAGLPISNLHQLDFATLDALVLSPGVPLTHPEPHWTVLKARHAGIEVIGDTEIFAREADAAGARIVAITGTNGKSTTTALTGHVLSQAGLDVEVGGNIGKAVFLLRQPVKGRVYVLELSSFQIDLMPRLDPEVGILTNITPDHLDRHGSMENYAAVKARMFASQHKGDTALCGVDDDWCAAIAEQVVVTGADVRRVSVVKDLDDGITAHDGVLRDKRAGVVKAEIDLRAMPALKGRHNWQNACMAYGAATALGVDARAMAAAMTSFPGLAHRMQQVARVGAIPFINDSKATNADAAEKALSSFTNIYWIAGGIAKAGGIEPLTPLFGNVARAYLIGQAARDFAATIGSAIPHADCGTLEKAVAAALRDAQEDGKPGAVVLLSPACASFDQYPNFEVRGDAFVKAVSLLPGVEMTIPGDAHAART